MINEAHAIVAGALNVSLQYLAGSSASLLDNILVEKEQLASAVFYATDDHPSIEIRFTLTSVETDKLAEVEKRFFDVLKEAMDKELDMRYLKECIDRQRRCLLYTSDAADESLPL